MKRAVLASLTLIAGLGAGNALAEPQAEVLHWWTSGGEARAVQTLMDEFQSNGGKWVDMPVAGGGGDAAMQALRARVLAGNAPTAVQLKGPSIQEWYEEGVLADLTGVGKAELRRAGQRASGELDLGEHRRAGQGRGPAPDQLG
jgi:glucose/mannose transport system substrate-binding protein